MHLGCGTLVNLQKVEKKVFQQSKVQMAPHLISKNVSLESVQLLHAEDKFHQYFILGTSVLLLL